jgi:hydroxyacylglutathione hydrolase
MLRIQAIAAFEDNYIWLLRDGQQAVAIDPGDAGPVIAALEQAGASLAAVLITHRHYDHTGGIAELAARYAMPVYGPAREKIAGLSHPLNEGDEVAVLGARLRVLEVFGHTAGHIAYVSTPLNASVSAPPDASVSAPPDASVSTPPDASVSAPPDASVSTPLDASVSTPPDTTEGGLLFCGDTLFTGGCGRLFEGSAAQMQASLAKIAALPDETWVYCAHEYTQANLRFARLVEPDNPALLARIRDTDARRARGLPTVPARLGLEKQSNPFLRWDVAAVKQAAESFAGRPLAHPAEIFGVLRRWKDSLD